MKLPEYCPFEVMPEDPFAVLESLFGRSESERFDCCRVHAGVLAMEEPLCRSQRIESEPYRFIWRSSFHGTAVVHIGRQGDAITLGWKYLSFRVRAKDEAPPMVMLSRADWNRLQHQLKIQIFGRLIPSEPQWVSTALNG